MSGICRYINLQDNPIDDPEFTASCHRDLERDGALILTDFLTPSGLQELQIEAANGEKHGFFVPARTMCF